MILNPDDPVEEAELSGLGELVETYTQGTGTFHMLIGCIVWDFEHLIDLIFMIFIFQQIILKPDIRF